MKKTMAAVEELEGRVLMALPQVTGIVADNRGWVTLGISEDLRPKTVSGSSVQMFTAGKDKKLDTRDDAKVKAKVSYSAASGGTDASYAQISIKAKLKANTKYRVLLIGSKIKAADDGASLDGEFKGAARPSGNGKAGGNYEIVTKPSSKPVARFHTADGIIDVKLLGSDVRTTVDNFIHYANEGTWDTSFFHRRTSAAEGISVIQGGGYRITGSNGLAAIQPDRPPVPLQAGISNLRGTLAMARQTAPNTGTVEWYFNYQDNTGLDPGQGVDGYAVFGRISDAAGLATLDRLANRDRVDARTKDGTNWNQDNVDRFGQAILGALGTLPVKSAATYMARDQILNPKADLVRINRVAIKMGVSKP